MALVASLALACEDPTPRTQVMVVLDAERGMREAVAALEVQVRGGTGREGALRVERFLRDFTGGQEGIGWPREVAVGPLDDDADRIFEVVGTARDAAGDSIGRVRAIGGYVEGETLMLLLVFQDSCRDELCTEETTCVDAACVSAFFDATTLPEYDPAFVEALRYGVIPPDGGVDGGPGAGLDGGGGPGMGDVMVGTPSCEVDNGGCDTLVSCAVRAQDVECGACPAGYRGEGDDACVDIDECEEGTDACDARAACSNEPGSYRCGDCPVGFSGGGDSGCVDIDECASDNGGCDAVVSCTNVDGGRTCGDCPSGYTGSGDSSCLDVDECLSGNGGCDPRSECTNTVGGRSCGACPSGFSGDGEAGCVDIDECASGNGGCDAQSSCSNSPPGSFTCGACASGYSGDGATGCSRQLSGLGLSTGGVSFDPAMVSYDIVADAYDETFVVTPAVGAGASITVNAAAASSGAAVAVALAPGAVTVITVVVSEPGQPDMTYTLNVDRRDVLLQDAYMKHDASLVTASGYGSALAADGDVVAVGAPRGSEDGAVHVYRVVDGRPQLQQVLQQPVEGEDSEFGAQLALSGDTLVVGSGSASGVHVYRDAGGGSWALEQTLLPSGSSAGFAPAVDIDGDRLVIGDRNHGTGGGVFVFQRSGSTWTEHGSVLTPLTQGPGDDFGAAVAVSGNIIAVGAPAEDAFGAGINNENGSSPVDETNNGGSGSGAAYAFFWTGAAWVQEAYIKAEPNTVGEAPTSFGADVDADGDTIVVGSPNENGGDEGVNPLPPLGFSETSGAAFVFVRDGSAMTWSQQARIKPLSSDSGDHMGASVAIDGDRLVVGVTGDDSGSMGSGGDPANDDIDDSGAAWVLERSGTTWSHVHYLKASNTAMNDGFGSAVAIAGGTVLVGAPAEDSSATGIDGAQGNDADPDSGAAYLY